MSREDRRRRNYRRLRDSGFNAKQATNLKNRSKRVISELCELKIEKRKQDTFLDNIFDRKVKKVLSNEND